MFKFYRLNEYNIKTKFCKQFCQNFSILNKKKKPKSRFLSVFLFSKDKNSFLTEKLNLFLNNFVYSVDIVTYKFAIWLTLNSVFKIEDSL